jgi:hypothetical protein
MVLTNSNDQGDNDEASEPKKPANRVTGPTEPPTQWVPGTVPTKIKRPGHKSDYPRPPSAEGNNQRSYTSAAPCALLVCTAFE